MGISDVLSADSSALDTFIEQKLNEAKEQELKEEQKLKEEEKELKEKRRLDEEKK